MALLDGGERSANVLALEPSEILVLGREAFPRLLSDSPALLDAVMTQLTRAVRETSGRLLREELEQRVLNAEMEAGKHRALAEMVAGVAHEINTPLGTVNTAVSIVRQRLESPVFRDFAGTSREARNAFEDATEALGLMERNIQRAHRLVQNFKKLSVSQISDTLENLNLLDVVEETVQLFSVNARQSGLSPRFTLEVRDFGQGMTADVVSRIFEPFFTTSRSVGGSGLGLSIVRNLVTVPLEGSIEVQSVPQQGTAFALLLPRAIQGESS